MRKLHIFLIIPIVVIIAAVSFGLQTQAQSAPPFCYNWNSNLRIGDRGAAVDALVTAMVKEGLISNPSNENITGEDFNEQLASAVVGFQEKYASEILTPNGLSRGTGYVGPSTRAKLNALYGCGGSTTPTNPAPPTIPPGGNCYVFTQNLTIGSTGPEVVALQTFLISKGFDIRNVSHGWTPKGYFGFQTAQALKQYQASVGIPATGDLGSLTRAKINGSCGSGGNTDDGTGTGSVQWILVSTDISSSPEISGVASSSVRGQITLKAKAVSGNLVKPKASDFGVVFASVPATSYTSSNSFAVNNNKVISVSPSTATIAEGGEYTVTITGVMYSNDPGFCSSQSLFMAIKDATYVAGGRTFQTQTSGLREFRTGTAQLTRGSGSCNPLPPTTPTVCTAVYAPVCSNGKTYSNSCVARGAGVTSYTEGACVNSSQTFSLSPSSYEHIAYEGDTGFKSVTGTFTNVSGRAVKFNIVSENQPSWHNSGYATDTLTASPNTPFGLGAGFDPTGLAVGTYTSSVQLVGDFPGSPVRIPVKLTIKPALGRPITNPTLSPSNQGISSGKTVFFEFTMPSNTTSAALQFSCPTGISIRGYDGMRNWIGSELCGTTQSIGVNSSGYEVIATNSSSQIVNASIKFTTYTTDSPTYGRSASAILGVSPAGTSQPSINVLSPNGGEGYLTGSVMNVKWNSSGMSPAENVKIQIGYTHNDRYYSAGTTFEDGVVASTANTGSFSWTIPDYYSWGVNSNSFFIRVTDLTSKATNISNGSFTIKPKSPNSLGDTTGIVTSPVAGQYKIGQSIKIDWSPKTGSYGFTLLKNNDRSFARHFFADTNNNWVIPSGIPPASDYFIRVGTNDGVNGVRGVIGYSSIFSITESSTQPSINVLSPNGGEVLSAGSYIPVTFTTNLPTGTAYEVSVVGKAYDSQLTSGKVTAGDKQTAYITVPNVSGNYYRIRVNSTICDSASCTQDQSNSDFTITSPTIPTSPLTASCSAYSSSSFAASNLVWTAQPSGGVSPYNYSWSIYNDVAAYNTGSTQSSTVGIIYSSTGTKQAVVRVTDATGQSTSATCSGTISPATTQASITPYSFTKTITVGDSLGQVFSVNSTSETWPYWSIGAKGEVPAGFSISTYGAFSGQLSGTPTTAGTYSFSVEARRSMNDGGIIAFVNLTVLPRTTTQPSITVLSPNGGAYKVGDSLKVQWQGPSSTGFNVYLSGGGNYEGYTKFIGSANVIATGNDTTGINYVLTSSDVSKPGGFTWAVIVCPIGQPTSSSSCGLSRTFTITSPTIPTPTTPVIQYISPSTGPVGTTITINGTGFGTNNNLYVDGSNNVTTSVSSSNGTSLTFPIPSFYGVGAHTFQIQRNDAGVTNAPRSNAGTFTVTAPTPNSSITVLSPNGGTYRAGDSLNIQWNVSDLTTANNSIGLAVYQKSLGSTKALLSTAVGNPVSGGQVSNSGSYNWVIPQTANSGSDYIVYLSTANAWVQSSTFTITAPAAAPTSYLQGDALTAAIWQAIQEYFNSQPR